MISQFQPNQYQGLYSSPPQKSEFKLRLSPFFHRKIGHNSVSKCEVMMPTYKVNMQARMTLLHQLKRDVVQIEDLGNVGRKI